MTKFKFQMKSKVQMPIELIINSEFFDNYAFDTDLTFAF